MMKDLEFDTVILWNSRMAKLLYMEATRALHELYVLEIME